MFQKDWFDIVPMPAIKMKKTVRRWDFASSDVKKGEDPDYTVGLKVGLGYDGLFYIIDMVRVRESPGRLDKTLRKTLQEDGKLVRQRSEQEPGSSGKIAVWHLARGPFLGYSYRGIRSTGPKILRAETVAAAVERGEYRLVRGRWNKEFLREVSRFPHDVHDDIVDALSGAHEDLTKRLSKMVTL
jgi:predicted phage terminase large subunit-like protein